MAGDAGDPALLLEARTAEAMVSFYLGELVTARDSAAQGIGIYDVRAHGSHALVYGQDPGTNCLSYAAWFLLLLGYPEQSRRKSDDMLALSEAVSHPLTRARALVMSRDLPLLPTRTRRGAGADQSGNDALATEEASPTG